MKTKSSFSAVFISFTTIAIFAFAGFLFAFFPTQTVQASGESWYDSSWSYRKAITLSPATPAANYQVKVALASVTLTGAQLTSGNANGNDIRFTGSDGATLQDYWTESWSATGTSVTATIWVEVTASGASTIYMYYGNSGAAAATNGTNTFDFFDDFSDGSLDTVTRWTKVGNNTLSFSGGEMTSTGVSGTSKIIAKSAPTGDNYIMRAKFKATAGTDVEGRAGLGIKTNLTNNYGYFYGFHDFTNLDERSFLDEYGVGWNVRAGSWLKSTWYTEEIYHNGTSVLARFDDGTWQTQSWSGRTGYPDLTTGYNAVTTVWDFAAVHKYTATEPSASLGSEEYLNYYTITGTAAMNAGASQVITITAKTNLGNTYGLTGDKSLTFSGANVSGGGNNPTCTDKTSADVNFSTATTVTLTSGAGTCTMKLYKAETAAINVTDGTITATGYTLSVAVSSTLSGASIQINNNDSYAISKDTALTLSATSASQMKFSNNNSAYSTYEAYGASKAWDITDAAYGGASSEGAKTVYVIFKDAYGNEAAAVNDNIVYDTTVPVNPSSAVDAQGAVSDTWQNNKNDPNFTSFTGASDTNGIAGYYVYFDISSTGTSATWVSSAAYDPASFSTSNTRYLRVIAKDNAGLYADPDGAGTSCTNTNASRPADLNCWTTIFIHKYDVDAPNTPSPVSFPVSWANTNSFNFSWSDPGDVGGSGIKDYTYETNAGTGATTAASASVNGLTSDTNGTKLFSVKANDNAGNSGSSGTVNFYYDGAGPTNAGAVTDGNGSLDDTWGIVSDPSFTWAAGSDTDSGVKEYDVYWGIDSGGTTVIATVAGNAYNAAAIPVNTPYYLRIRTRDNAGNVSAWATKYTMKYSQAASAPSGLSQTANAAGLALGDWTSDTTPTLNFILTDPDSDTLGYVIEVDNNSDFSSPEVFYTYGANDLVSGAEYSFTVGQAAGAGTYTNGSQSQTLAEGSYYWKVKAIESHGLASSEVSANGGAMAFGIDTSNPTSTTLGFGAIAADSITATVSGAADSMSGLHATPYYFENMTAAANSGWQTETSWNSGILTANTQYTFKVTAKDKAGNTETTATQAKYTFASQISNLTAANATDKTSYKINLSWTNQSQSGIKIEQDANCDGYETTLYDNVSANPSSPYAVSVSANTCYKFRISSYNGDGTLNTTSIPETSQITSPAAQPASLTHTTNTLNSISWDWADVTDATGYKIYNSSDDTLLDTIVSAASSWDQTILLPNTIHTVYIRVTNANGEGIASAPASAYTAANAPINPGHSSNTNSAITWTWASGGAQKDYFAWTSAPSDNSGWVASPYWTQSSLSSNTRYTFSVKARNDNLDETNSISGSFYTSQADPSGISFGAIAVSSIAVSDSGTFMNLDQESSGLYFLNVTNSDTTGWIQTNSWVNSSLSPNTQYSYKVKARNGDSDETSYTVESAKYTLANTPSIPTINNSSPTTLDINPDPNSNPAFTEFAIYKKTGATCDGIGGSYIKADGSDNGATAVWQTDTQWSATTVTGLSENTEYFFCVKARNGDNTETSFSAAANGITTISNTVPNIPTLVSPASSSYTNDNTPTLSANYSDPDTGDTGTTNYRVSSTSLSDCANNINIVSSGSSSQTLSNSENTSWTPSSSIGSDGTYYWCAQNNDGLLTSAWTGMGSFILDTASPAGAALSLSATTVSITATVSNASDSASGLHASPYYFENTTAGTNSGWIADTSWVSSDLSCGTSYSLRVKTRDVLSNESSFTSSTSFSTSSCPGGGLPPRALTPPAMPQGGFGIAINNSSFQTNSRIITLNFNAGSDAKRMSISEDPNFTNSSQEPYAPSKTLTLSKGEGTKTIYIRFYTQYGVSSPTIAKTIVFKADSSEQSNLVRSSNDYKVYLIENNQKRWIKTQEEFISLNYNWKDISIITPEELASYPNTPSDIQKNTQTYSFGRDLKLGDRGEDIRNLQKFLNNKGFIVSSQGPGSSNNETDFFGRATRNALMKFQKAHNLPTTGYFGAMTRGAIQP